MPKGIRKTADQLKQELEARIAEREAKFSLKDAFKAFVAQPSPETKQALVGAIESYKKGE